MMEYIYMGSLLIILLFAAIVISALIIIFRRQKKSKRIMREGKLLKSETISQGGDMFYVEKVAFKDWHVSLH